jgi:hypothetical protein
MQIFRCTSPPNEEFPRVNATKDAQRKIFVVSNIRYMIIIVFLILALFLFAW